VGVGVCGPISHRQNDPTLEDVNVQDRVNAFVDAVNSYYVHNAKTGHVMFQMGSDFQYEVSVPVVTLRFLPSTSWPRPLTQRKQSHCIAITPIPLPAERK
jgi:hypothetical protein